MTSDAVDTFVREARACCSFVETAAQPSLAARLQAAHSRLLALYTAALALPRFSFAMQWSDHAIDALRALHRACVKEVS
jgi:hypothetical protein